VAGGQPDLHSSIWLPSASRARILSLDRSSLGPSMAPDRSEHKSALKAAHQPLPLVYDELRKPAAHKMAQEAPGETLESTAPVHEAWLRLGGKADQEWQGRAHFFRMVLGSARIEAHCFRRDVWRTSPLPQPGPRLVLGIGNRAGQTTPPVGAEAAREPPLIARFPALRASRASDFNRCPQEWIRERVKDANRAGKGVKPSGEIWAAGNTGTNQGIGGWVWLVRKSADGGDTWTTVDSVWGSSVRAGWALGFTSSGAVFVAGVINDVWTVRRSTDDGASWTTVDS
jgi:ECF sigma factor